jgi:hypothetical protein
MEYYTIIKKINSFADNNKISTTLNQENVKNCSQNFRKQDTAR